MPNRFRVRDLDNAIHAGIATATARFETWTGGETVRDYGVESLLTTYVAQEINSCLRRCRSDYVLSLEHDFEGIIEQSARIQRRGRVPADYAALRQKPRGRVDIVLWRGYRPFGVLEIKRGSGSSELRADAARVMSFAAHCGRRFGGSIQRAIVACVLMARREPTTKTLLQMHQLRRQHMVELASQKGFAVITAPPRRIRIKDPGGHGSAFASAVYRFERPRA